MPLRSIKLVTILSILKYYANLFKVTFKVTNLKYYANIYWTEGASDRAVILIDNKEKAVAQGQKEFDLDVNDSDFDNKTVRNHRVDIIVENIGRAKIGTEMNSARKGLNADVVIDNQTINRYEIFSLEFQESYVQSLKTMKGKSYVKRQTQQSPTLYRAELDIKDKPRDTFLRLDNWKKGVVFVNNFNIGRYWSIGPEKTLYLPAPLLKTGSNDIFIFELHSATDKIESVSEPDLGK